MVSAGDVRSSGYLMVGAGEAGGAVAGGDAEIAGRAGGVPGTKEASR